MGGTISISRTEERKNAGEGRILSLLEAKIKQAEMTMREKLNHDLIQGTVNTATFVPETSSGGNLGFLPLGYFLRLAPATDPLVGGNVGNISSASNSWWRAYNADLSSDTATNKTFAKDTTTYAGIKAMLKRMYMYCSRGSGGSPDLVVMDQVSYETYENALDTQVRYTDTKFADLGFENIKLKGATCIWDEQVPDMENGTVAITTGTAFFVNTKFYELVMDSETDIVTTPFMSTENQNVRTAKILAMGNACVSNLRKHGLVYGISQSIVA